MEKQLGFGKNENKENDELKKESKEEAQEKKEQEIINNDILDLERIVVLESSQEMKNKHISFGQGEKKKSGVSERKMKTKKEDISQEISRMMQEQVSEGLKNMALIEAFNESENKYKNRPNGIAGFATLEDKRKELGKKRKPIDTPTLQAIKEGIEKGELSFKLQNKIVRTLSNYLRVEDENLLGDIFIDLINDSRFIWEDVNEFVCLNFASIYNGVLSQVGEGKELGEKLRLINALEFLDRISYSHRIDIEDLQLEDQIDLLKEKSDNYFINIKVEASRWPRLRNRGVQEKRLFLAEHLDSVGERLSGMVHVILNEHRSSKKIDKRKYEEALEDLRSYIKYEFSDDEIEKAFYDYTRNDLLLPGGDPAKKVNIMIMLKFADEALQNSYYIEPLRHQRKVQVGDETRFNTYHYIRISDDYGSVYSDNGHVDSFFALDPKTEKRIAGEKIKTQENSSEKEATGQKPIEEKIKPERLTIQQILEREGFQKDKMPEEEYKKMILTYRSLLELPLREKIEQEFDIKISDFSVREQVQFVNFLSSKTEKEVLEVKNFLNQGKKKHERVKAFLSLEFGKDLSKDILNIASNIEPEQADLIFAKYAEIADLAREVEKELTDSITSKEKVKLVSPQKISQDLLRRGKDILVDFSQEVSITKEDGGEISMEGIISRLEDYQSSLVFQAATIKEGKKYGLAFEDFEGSTCEVLTAEQVFENSDMVEQMRIMQRKNWAHEKNEEFREVLHRGLHDKLKSGGKETKFFILQKELLSSLLDNGEDENAETEKTKKVIAFCRVDEKSPGETYFGSLNVLPVMHGSALAWVLKEVAIGASASNVEADCDPFDSRATPVYVEKDGFVIRSSYEYKGKYSFNIIREGDEANKKYFFRKKTQAEVVAYHIAHNFGNSYEAGDELIVLKLPAKQEEFRSLIDDLLNNQKYVGTRYFPSEDKQSIYCALERGGSSS